MVSSARYLAFNKKEYHLFSVVCPQDIEQERLKPLIFKCLKENPPIKKICFAKEGDSLVSEVEAEEGEKTLFQGREEPQLMRLGIAKPLPLKVKTVDRVYRRLHKKWKSPYTVIDFFLSLVLYPVALLSCLVYPDKEINKQLQKYIDSQTPSSFDALCRLLKQRKEMVARWGKQTVELDKVLSLALEMKRTGDLSSICQKALQKEGEVAFPGGYYQEEESFAPVIYRVGPKNQEGKRALEIYFLAPPFEKIIYTPLKEEELHSLLVSSLAKSFPKEEKDSAKQAQVFFQAAQQGLSSDAAKRGMKKEAEQDVERSFRDYLLSPVQIETRELICGELLTLFQPEKEEERQISLLIQLIEDETFLLSQGSSNQAALDHLEQLKGKLQALLDPMLLSIDDVMNQAKCGDHTFSQSVIRLDKKSAAQSSLAERIAPEFHLFLSEMKQNLYAQYGCGNVPAIQRDLSSHLSLAQKYMDQGEYQKGYEIALILLETLPCPHPSLTESHFWSTDALKSFETLNLFAASISEATTLMWEASLRLEKRHMTPPEFSALILSRAVLIRIAREKSELVRTKLQKCSKKIPALSSYLGGRNSFWHIKEDTWKQIIQEGELTYEEATALVFDPFQTNTHLLRDILFYHPHLRLGLLPKGDRKIAGSLAYLESVGPVSGKKMESAVVIRLDAEVDAPMSLEDRKNDTRTWFQGISLWKETYSQSADRYYLLGIIHIAKAFGKNVDEKALWNEIDPKNSQHLPKEMIHLRRHVVIFQNLLQPEGSMALHFGDTGRGFHAVDWWLKIEKQALEKGAGDLDQKKEWMLKIAYEQLRQKIQTMKGRLKLSSGLYVDSASQAIVIENDRGEKIYYVPWGLGLPDPFDSLFERSSDEMNSRGLGGKVPSEWLIEGVGKGGEDPFLSPTMKPRDVDPLMERKKSAILFGKRYFPNEPTLLSRLIEESDDSMKEYLLRTLTISTDSKQILPRFSEIREGLFLIGGRPELLLDHKVRAFFDLFFSKPFGIQGFIRQYPELLSQVACMLRKGVDEALSQGQVEVALYLVRLGSLFKGHLEYYRSYQEKDPYLSLFSLDKKEIAQEDLDEAIRKMPSYEQDLSQFQGKEKQFPDLIRLARAEFLYFKQKQSTSHYFIKERSVEELVDLIRLKQSLEGSIDHVGTPMFNAELLHWIEQDIFPRILQHMESHAEIKNQMCNLLAGDFSEGSWEREKASHIYRKGTIILNLDTLTVTGKVTTSVTCQTILPEKIGEAIIGLDRLFPQGIQEVSRQFDQQSGGWIYDLKNGYRIIDQKGKQPFLEREMQGKTCRLVSHYSGSGTLWDIAKGFFLWESIETDQEPHYFIPTDNGCFSFKLSQEGGVNQLAWEQEEVEQVSYTALGDSYTASPSSYLFRSKDGNKIYLVDLGITLERQEERWTFQGEKLISAPRHLTGKARFFSRLLGAQGALCFQTEKSTHFLIKPHDPSEKIEKKKTSLSEMQNIPLLSLVINEKGAIKTTTGGFLYLAYQAAVHNCFEESIQFLKEAGRRKISGEKEKEEYLFISTLIRETGQKVPLFYLKALYTLDGLEKGQRLLSKGLWEDQKKHFMSVTEVAKIYEKVISERKEKELTFEEQMHFEGMRKEALRSLFSNAAKEIKAPCQALPTLEECEIDANFYSYLAAMLQPDLQKFKIPPPHFDPQEVLTFFSCYVDAVSEGKLCLDNIHFLFTPFMKKKGADPFLYRAGEVGRKLLIHLILAKEEGREIPRLEWGLLEAQRKKVPTQVSDRKVDLFLSLLSQQWEALKKGHFFFDFNPLSSDAVDILKALQTWLKELPLDLSPLKGKYLSDQGIKEEEEIKKIKEDEIDINLVRERFKEISQEIQFNPVEAKIFEIAFERCIEEGTEKISIFHLREAIDEALKLSSVEMRRETLLAERIFDLEQKLETKPPLNAHFSSPSLPPEILAALSPIDLEEHFHPVDQERLHRLTEDIPKGITEGFTPDQNNPSLAEEYQQIQQGVVEVKERLIEEASYQRRLKEETLGQLKDKIDSNIEDLAKGKPLQHREKILQSAKTPKMIHASSRLKEMSKIPDLFCEEDWIEEMLDLYQFGNVCLTEDLIQDIELFIRYSTYFNELQRRYTRKLCLKKNERIIWNLKNVLNFKRRYAHEAV